MKKCSWCGKEFLDAAVVWDIDGEPLKYIDSVKRKESTNEMASPILREQCPNCYADVMFVSDICPSCQNDRRKPPRPEWSDARAQAKIRKELDQSTSLMVQKICGKTNKKGGGFLRLVGIVLISFGLLLGVCSQYLFNDLEGEIGHIEMVRTPGTGKAVGMITDAGQTPALGTFRSIAVCLSVFGVILLSLGFVTRKSPEPNRFGDASKKDLEKPKKDFGVILVKQPDGTEIEYTQEQLRQDFLSGKIAAGCVARFQEESEYKTVTAIMLILMR